MCVWDIIQPLKINLVICKNDDEPLGFYSKWNKSEEDKTVISSIGRIKKKAKPSSYRYREQIGGCTRWGVEVGEMIKLFFFNLNKLNRK